MNRRGVIARTARRRPEVLRADWARRALLSVLVLAILLFTLHTLRLSDASYTAASNNSVNIYTAGSLSHTNDCDGQVMLSASGLKPGLSSVGIMTLTGTGDGPGTYTLDDAGLVDVPDSPALSDTLVFTVEDITGTPVTLFSGLMSDFDSANLGSIAPLGVRSYRVTVAFPSGHMDSGLQGAVTTLVLEVTGVSS